MEHQIIRIQAQLPQTNLYDEFVGLTKFLETQLKYYHWQTNSYSEHKVLDEIISDISVLIDKYVESYQGLYQTRIKPVEVPEITSYECKQQVLEELKSYKDFAAQMKDDQESALSNIVEEIVAVIGKGIYLLSLNG
ncbi:MAG: DUF5856 family protein [Candidatus Dojkabacteria bacterium]|nr:DUF5856 family protein [Candidatus Dojkabacteria bacterium]